MEEGQLDRLLDLVGPATRPELLSRLRDDLLRSAAALAAALLHDDRPSIRAETHILTAVAGAVGANGLADDTRALNEAAKDTGALPPDLGPRIASEIRALLALVAARTQAAP